MKKDARRLIDKQEYLRESKNKKNKCIFDGYVINQIWLYFKHNHLHLIAIINIILRDIQFLADHEGKSKEFVLE